VLYVNLRRLEKGKHQKVTMVPSCYTKHTQNCVCYIAVLQIGQPLGIHATVSVHAAQNCAFPHGGPRDEVRQVCKKFCEFFSIPHFEQM